MPIQLKNLMPVGTAMMSVVMLKNGSDDGASVNMWWAQTVNEHAPMRIARVYEGPVTEQVFAANTVMISEMMPMNGNATT